MARMAWALGLLLCGVVPAGPVGAQAASPADAFVEEAMPYLGYTVHLPGSWERVEGDTSMPVPSIESVADRDQVTAQALAAAAEHIAADGGLLDPMGLWAVDPASLLQLGVLAGDPYRIDADDLRASVEASVAERGSDMGDRLVEPVALPAGGGFRATYLNAIDLAQHVEYHLRTSTGRYLVLAATLPGLFDESLSAVVDEVARSLAPITGSSGDRPAPFPLASSPPATDLLASLPARVGGVELERQLLDGESLVTSSGEASGSLASSMGVLVDAPADLTLAIGTPADSDQDLVVAAFALAGVDRAELDAVLGTFPEEVWSRSRLGPLEVLVSVRGDGGRHTWLWSGALPTGDAVLYQVDSTNGTLAREVIGAVGDG
ncbi:MAG: hypothetical protein ABWZ82_01945 [Candidatus Limnocylindrales bacterium]